MAAGKSVKVSSLRVVARLGIAALLVAGSFSSLLTQWRATLAPGISAFDVAHPEVPGDDPATLFGTLEAAAAAVGPEDSLGVLYSAADSNQVFVAFRLAYLLYPKLVVGQTYPAGKLADEFASLRERGTTLILLLGASDLAPSGAEALPAPGPGAWLFRVRGTPR